MVVADDAAELRQAGSRRRRWLPWVLGAVLVAAAAVAVEWYLDGEVAELHGYRLDEVDSRVLFVEIDDAPIVSVSVTESDDLVSIEVRRKRWVDPEVGGEVRVELDDPLGDRTVVDHLGRVLTDGSER